MSEKESHSNRFTINKEFDPDILWVVIKKYWLVFPILLLISLSAGYLYLRYTKPVYSSNAVVQRSSQDEGKRILDIESFESEGSLSEDVELLKSTFLLEKALKNLNLNISYYSEGEILTEEKYLMSSYHVTLLELKDSSLIGRPIAVTEAGEGYELSFQSNGELKTFAVQPNEPINNDYFNLIFKINNKVQFNKSMEGNSLYFVMNNYASLTKRLHPDLKVYILNAEAKTLQISFESNNSRLATDVVSSVITTFFQYDLDKKSQSSANILNFINSQLDTAFIQLKESEVRIQSFKDSNRVNDPAMFTQRILQRTGELQSQLLTIDLDYELISEVERKVDNSERIEIYKIIPAISGTNYEKILTTELTTLHDLLVSKEDVSYNVTGNNDIVKKLNRKIETKSENIKRTISAIKEQLRFKKSSVQDRIYGLESQLYGVPQKEMELSRLNRMFNLNEKYYSLLIEKKTQYSISKAGYTTDNMVLQAPSSAGLVSPNGKLIYTGLIVMAVLLGFIYLLVRYLRFNDIQSPEELKKILPSKAGFLGIVPKVTTDNKNSTLIVHKQPKSALAESCRHIRSNMQFILNEGQSSVVAVSSSVSGEGKTFVALNLAGIFALSGKKVLVIDLDLRKPKVHHGFGVENTEGMSSVFANKINWKECVRNSEIDGLSFITAGPIPPNPSELIIRGDLDNLLEEFKGEYDLILIDNPPVGVVSDGVLIMNKADCPIYVFRSNYSKRIFTERVGELLNSNKVSKLFVLLNGVDLKRNGYGYGYGYGYGEYYDDNEGGQKKGLFKWFKKK
ncbi:MAG: polysaccharide biosynthesis tyrosine autokinase [Crocinitomix sp.]|nr:polysaccharide biosynthesis tyrosine autokinase [Crocinitomix sp.]